MNFILGNEAVLRAFCNAKKSGQHSHAYIIEGATGSGRLTLARAISATLICPDEKACYSCPSCKRITQGIHQDVKEVRCEEGASSIKIDQIRDIITQAYIKPAECDKKIFIVENAQQMGPAAQNALLQIFEEPPKNVVFFLLTTNRNLLLSTLKSRAVTLKTEKFSDAFIKEELLRRYPENTELADEATLIADGALGQALAFMDSEENRKAMLLVKTYFSALDKRATYATLSSILVPGVAGDKNYLFAVMNCFSLALRDIITFSAGYKEKVMFFADRELLRILADRLDRKKLFSAYDTICAVMRYAAKINVSLALSNINTILSDDL